MILDLLTQHGIPIKQVGEHHHATPQFIQVDCPFCSPNSRRFRLGLAKTGTHATCWQCGPHSIVEALHHLTGTSYDQLKSLLKSHTPKYEPQITPKGTYREPPKTGQIGPVHRKYLKTRGYTPDLLQTLWKVQGIGLSRRLQWRLFIPIYFRGEPVSWTTRSISDNHPQRYINARPEEESIPLKNVVYGFDFIRHAVILVEGPLDVWSIGPGACATFGTSYTKSQLELISRIPLRVVCYDNEREAQKRARRLVSDLSVFPGDTFNVQLDSKDPGSATKQEIRELRRRFLK